MKNQKIITHSAEETRALGAQLAQTFKGGHVVLLEGDLGAGKTHFAQGVAHAFRIKKHITSPTFTIMNVYNIPVAKQSSGIKCLAHIDLYRIKTPEEAYVIGVMDYIGEPSTLTLIEWPKKIQNALPKDCARVHVTIKTRQKEIRVLTISFN
ncbi:MAG: tRNA (adenosine(37)-N6)-threonylcarbamoyltransferase complex ATPase subunit type 1 TsaE [Candidatus Magasanikbacteria bacterium]|nr:tRNA (adenosine(37)-N6)-threonylcarbamoyltransferase complex ATPase subunit type 1 TsaE [Candidatus Magasanikbacteria bacterium]